MARGYYELSWSTKSGVRLQYDSLKQWYLSWFNSDNPDNYDYTSICIDDSGKEHLVERVRQSTGIDYPLYRALLPIIDKEVALIAALEFVDEL